MLDAIFDCCSYALLVILCFGPILLVYSAKFRYVAFMTGVYAAVFVAAILAFPVVLLRPYNVRNHKWVMNIYWALTYPWTCVEWSVEDEQILRDIKGPCIIAANHQSSIDLLGLPHVWPERGGIMAKSSLKYAGLLGVSATLSSAIFINRFHPATALQTMERTRKAITEKDMQLFVYVEGTRNHEGGMLPFKKGAFHMAVQCQIPIVPVVYSSYAPFYSKREWRIQRGAAILKVLPPIPTDGLDAGNVADLAVRTRETMLATFDEISERARTRTLAMQAQ